MPISSRSRRFPDPVFDARRYGTGTLLSWWDGSRLALNDSDPISTLPDLSGRGNDATNSGTNRPVFKANIQNGLPGMLFTIASSQYFLANGLASALSGADLPYTFVVVCQPNVVSGATYVLGAWGSSSASRRIWNYINATTFIQLRKDDAAVQLTVPTAAIATTTTQILAFVNTGTAIQTWRNGSWVGGFPALDTGTITLDRFTLGANIDTGVAANFFGGYMFEGMIYTSALPSGEHRAIQTKLARKWMVPLP